MNYLGRALVVLDFVVMTLSLVAAAFMVDSSLSFESVSGFLAVRHSIGNVLLFLILMFIWYAMSVALELGTVTTLEQPVASIRRVLIFVTFGVATVAVVAAFFAIEIVDAEYLAYFWILASVCLIAERFSLAVIYRRALGNIEDRPSLLFIGINLRSIQLADDICAMQNPSHRIAGFVDDADYKTSLLERSPYERVASMDSVLNYIRQSPIDEVVISLPMKSRYDDASRIVSICEEQGIKLRIMADLFQYRMTHSRAEKFGGGSVITVAVHGMTGLPAAFKRLFDIMASGIALVVLAPVFVLISIAVKLDSPGGAFFRQERVGLNKKNFHMIKFRTMVVDAEEKQAAIEFLNESAGPAFKIRNDPRITNIGLVLRRMSLDELPQLINVVRGEMSLVGPRPLPLRDYGNFSEDWHRRRVSVRPGLTGMWQVESRSHESFDSWMKLDMQYIDRWSLWLDLKIILKTIPAILRGSGG